MRLALVSSVLALAFVGNVATKEITIKGLWKAEHANSLTGHPNAIHFNSKNADALSKQWSKFCTKHITSKQGQYVYRVSITSIIMGPHENTRNCSMYVESSKSIVDVTSEVNAMMPSKVKNGVLYLP